MTRTTRQKIEANREAYRKGKIPAFPRTEAECKDEEDRKCLRIARDCGEFCAKLDRAYEMSKNSQLVFGPGSFPRDSARNSGIKKMTTRGGRN